MALLLTGCSTYRTQPPLTDLHLPGVRKIANLDKIQPGEQIIGDAAAYSPFGTSDTRVIFQATHQLYSIRLDGTDVRSISAGNPCYGAVAPLPDGRSVVCSDDGGIEVISLAPDAPFPSAQVLRAMLLERMWSPTLSPDGSVLAVLHRGPNGGCTVAFYRFPIASGSASSLLATLTFPMFTGSSGTGCELSMISWSRDGAWLALGQHASPFEGVYVLSLANRVPLAVGSEGGPVALTITWSDLVLVGEGYSSTRFAWSRRGAHQLLTLVDKNLSSVVQVDPLTAVQRPVLTMPTAGTSDTTNYGFLCALTWTPDGARLIFVDCSPGGIEWSAVPSKLYVYTPPSA
jgi:hypothetical protein